MLLLLAILSLTLFEYLRRRMLTPHVGDRQGFWMITEVKGDFVRCFNLSDAEEFYFTIEDFRAGNLGRDYFLDTGSEALRLPGEGRFHDSGTL